RLLAVLSDLKEAFGNRPLVAARELTKHYEEVLRFDLDSSLEYFAANPPRGEFTLLVQGAEVLDEELPSDEVLISLMDKLLAKGLSRKAAAKELASRYQDVSVKYLYDISLK
ncbi:MAG: 16S rRNA (cytidine(1402)-2'-O)-methyltransferase, partial [Clostridiales bacterium]